MRFRVAELIALPLAMRRLARAPKALTFMEPVVPPRIPAQDARTTAVPLSLHVTMTHAQLACISMELAVLRRKGLTKDTDGEELKCLYIYRSLLLLLLLLLSLLLLLLLVIIPIIPMI